MTSRYGLTVVELANGFVNRLTREAKDVQEARSPAAAQTADETGA